MVRPVHFYHLYAGWDSLWMAPVFEHFTALRDAGFVGDVVLGVVGSPQERELAVRIVREFRPEARVSVEADEGYEMITLGCLHHAVQQLARDTPVLYAHTKGSWRTTDFQNKWRRRMTRDCITGWRHCIDLLQQNDLVGSRWMISGGFAGNFWWANAGYLAALPVIAEYDRWQAEVWIGQKPFKVFDLDPTSLDTIE